VRDISACMKAHGEENNVQQIDQIVLFIVSNTQ